METIRFGHKFAGFTAFSLTLCCITLLSIPASAKELIIIDEAPVPLASSYMLTPQTGNNSVGGGNTTIDISNTAEGYVMIKYSGTVSKIKVQITKSGSTTYTYNLAPSSSYTVFPLTSGNGNYSINVFENVSGNQYALAYGTSVEVSLRSSTAPFLYPNQFVSYNADSATVQKGATLAEGAANKLAIVSNVYNYVIANIKYDDAKAASVSSGGMAGYVPNVDSILSSGKGICFDYAAVMATMLRSQQIPTQMQLGWVSGGIYHAWINVYITDVGWLNNVIYFDGINWKLMDPTFAASSNQSSDIMRFIGNSSNYSTVYVY